MITLTVRNVNDAYAEGMRLLNVRGVCRESRVGPVLRLNSPVTTTYHHPTERVLFDERRDANPFFHLFEALWMLDGNNDLETLTRLLPSFTQFSDDGVTLHGAYGYRWRQHFVRRDTEHAGMIGEFETATMIDQLAIAIEMLRKNPNDRRVIIQIWDVFSDLDAKSADIPCNDMIKLAITDGRLDMFVFCRSNDIVFGAYGANAVHMSILQEYLAACIGVPVGVYEQISCDYHAYLETPYRFDSYFPVAVTALRNDYSGYTVCPLVDDPASFDQECRDFVTLVRSWHPFPVDVASSYRNSFFLRVVWPMYTAFRMHKNRKTQDAIALLHDPTHIDWLVAGQRWLIRRLK